MYINICETLNNLQPLNIHSLALNNVICNVCKLKVKVKRSRALFMEAVYGLLYSPGRDKMSGRIFRFPGRCLIAML